MKQQSDQKTELLTFVPRPDRPPVVVTYGLIGWSKKHLFGSFWNTLLTVAVFTLLFMLLKPVLEWSVFKAVWSASNRRECMNISPDGACWAGVIDWFNNLIYGRYPNDQQWRVNLGFGLGFLWLLPLAFKKVTQKMEIALMAMILFPLMGDYLFLGGDNSGLQYFIACAALAYIGMMYVNIILLYRGSKQIGEYLEPLIERFYPAKAALLGHWGSWLFLTVLIAMALQSHSL
ncbi:MAG: polar amino acid ABC transporter permease, partial [SAR324 cluster bacterium]